MSDLTISLTTAEVNQIGRALSNLPFKEVALLIGKLHEQVDAQMKTKEESDAKSDSVAVPIP